VNDRPLTSAQLDQLAERAGKGNSKAWSAAERRALIDQLLDEELLLQRAESLGLLDADPGPRKAMVQAAIDHIVENFLASSPDSQQLKTFYRQHERVFEEPARIAVSALQYANLAAAQRAFDSLAATDAWAGLVASPGASPVGHLPHTPLPAHVLRRYLGPGPTRVALTLSPGEISAPVKGAGGAYLLRVTQTFAARSPHYEEIVPVVRQEYLARGRELALTQQLATLWRAADVHINPLAEAGRPGHYVNEVRR
jgi:hypothetical protein